MSKKLDVREIARRGYWRETEARAIVEAWRQSGEPLPRFAKRHGIKRGRLGRWASRFKKKSPTTPVRFFPVRLCKGSGDGDGGSPIEIELGNGRRVRVPPGFAVEDLRRVLAALGEGAC